MVKDLALTSQMNLRIRKTSQTQFQSRLIAFMMFLTLTNLNYSLLGQNLVPNSSFEEFQSINLEFAQSLQNNCYYYIKTDKFNVVKQLISWETQCVGSLRLINNTLDYSKEKYFYWKKYINEPKDGSFCLGLESLNLIDKRGNNTCFLQNKLSQTLLVGKVYRVSMWLSIPIEYNKDSTSLEHFGLSFLREPIDDCAPYLTHKNWRFTIHNPPYNKWFQAVWYLRPLCNLNYLVIGTTHTKDWPKQYQSTTSLVFVDNVSITEVSEDSIIKNNIITTPFCKAEEWETLAKESALQEILVHFDTNSFEIDSTNKVVLLQVLAFDKLNPHENVYTISGFTDNTGNENDELSRNRAEAVKKYLMKYGRMDSLQFISYGYGSKLPISTSNSAQSRSLNRRVQIIKSEQKYHQQIYRKVLNLILNKQYNESYIYLRKWMEVAPNFSKIFILFDPRLTPLKQNKKWNPLIQKIKDTYKHFKYPELSFYLDSLYCEDQMGRTLIDEINFLASSKDKNEFDINEKDLRANDEKKNQMLLKALKDFIHKYDLPIGKIYGTRPASAAFLIIQHSKDTSDFLKYVELFHQKCLAGEANWSYYARLKDKSLKDAGKKLMYATLRCPTVFEGKPAVQYCDSEPLEKVNLERRKIGMAELSEEAFHAKYTVIER